MILDLGKHIKELLLLHDCVILPDLGGFVANYKPAVFDPVRNTASPPSKHILFNRNLVHNDGLLFAHVSAVTGYGYKDVQNMAGAYIEGIRKDVEKGMKFIIEGLGYFYIDGDREIQFTEESGNNFLLESYGLPLLQYREFEKLPRADSYRTLSTEADPRARQIRIRRWIYGTAAACLLTAMVLIPIRTGYFNQAGIDIPAKDSFRKEQAAGAERFSESGSAGTAANTDHATYDAASAESTVIISPVPDLEYHIVVGSFRDFGNARMLRNKLAEDGYNARILTPENGFFRVTAGTYPQQNDAAGDLATIRRNFESAWILSN